jgi:D-alanyl-D-alanine carboxypeptidase
LARGYQLAAKGVEEAAEFLHMSQVSAAGALVSTVDDLWRWEKQLATGRLVNQRLLERAWTEARLPDGRGTGYGYGWGISQVAGHRTHEHGGAINGFTSYDMAIPDEGVYVFVLANNDLNETRGAHRPTDIAVKIAHILLGGSTPPAVPAPKELSSLTGVYRINPQIKRVITVEDGVLYTQATGRPRFRLVPVGIDRFMVVENETYFLFKRDATGHVAGILARGRLGPELYAPRVDD